VPVTGPVPVPDGAGVAGPVAVGVVADVVVAAASLPKVAAVPGAATAAPSTQVADTTARTPAASRP
jgi:hypothetical protein